MSTSTHRSGGPAPGAVRRPDRLLGVDAARGLALLGMMGTHLVATTAPDGGISWSHVVFSGRASALFAVLAGVGLALATGRTEPPRGRALRAASAGVLARAAVVFVVGLLVGVVAGNIYVILAYYGLLFAVASVFVGLRARWLAVLGGVWLLASPVAGHLLRPLVGGVPTFDVPTPASLLHPLELLSGLALTGVYPVLEWTGYLLVGMAVGRCHLERARTAAVVLGTGVVMAVAAPLASAAALRASGGLLELVATLPPSWPVDAAGLPRALQTFFFGSTPSTSWAWLTVAAPHSATPFDLVGTTGTALAALGALLLIARVGPRVRLAAPQPRPLGALLLVPLAGAGAMTLTLYSLHVLTAPAAVAVLGPGGAWALSAAGAVAVGLAFREAGQRGPLESVAASASAAARHAAS